MILELAVWLERIVAVLPNLINLWGAAKSGNPQAELNESLLLIRAMKDRQAREEIAGP